MIEVKKNRLALIENALDIRAFKKDDVLFVNILSAIKPFAFTCNTKELTKNISMHLKNMPVISSYSIGDSKFTNILKTLALDESEQFVIAKLVDGGEFNCLLKDFNYETLAITANEVEELILSKIQEF